MSSMLTPNDHTWNCSSHQYGSDNDCDCEFINKRPHRFDLTKYVRPRPELSVVPEAEIVPTSDRIISLSGYAQSGKDSVAKYLVEERGYIRIAFADELRNRLLILNPLVPVPAGSHYHLKTIIDIIGWDNAKTDIPEVRRLLQVFGQEVGRETIDENLWVNKAVEKFEPGKKYVVTDTRYPNEFDRLRDLGATMVWIQRPGIGPLNPHGSENSITDYHFDVFIENNGSLDELKEQALRLGREHE